MKLMLGNSSHAHPASRFACWVVDVDVRLTDESSALAPLQFVAQTHFDEELGDLFLTEAAPRKGDPLGATAQSQDSTQYGPQGGTGEMGGVAGPPAPIPEEEAGSVTCGPLSRGSGAGIGVSGVFLGEDAAKLRRFAVVCPTCRVLGLERLNYGVLFQVAKTNGLSFDLYNNTGCLFLNLEVFHGLLSLAAVERTPEDAIVKISQALGVLADLGAKGPPKGLDPRVKGPQTVAVAGSSVDGSDDVYDGPVVYHTVTALRGIIRRNPAQKAKKKSGGHPDHF